MILGIISDCIHYKIDGDKIGSKVHVFVKQMNHLSEYFDKVYVCAPVLDNAVNYNAVSCYTNKHIKFLPIPTAGGTSIFKKLGIILVLPIWIYRIVQICRKSDLLYLRAPNNISIPGFIISSFFRKKRFSTYTGTWSGYKDEPFTYALQRKYLARYFKGPVFVYGRLSTDRDNIHETLSPSYNLQDWDMETCQVEVRLESLGGQDVFSREINLITVGSLIENKNQIFILEAMTKLKRMKIKFRLWVAGEGENLQKYQDFVRENDLVDEVIFLGNIKQSQLREYYRKSDIIVQAPIHEGFGKVPIEGFFHGVIPVIRDVNLSKKIIGDNMRGRVFNDQDELIDHINSLMQNPVEMIKLIKNGRDYALKNTLEYWGESIYKKVNS